MKEKVLDVLLFIAYAILSSAVSYGIFALAFGTW